MIRKTFPNHAIPLLDLYLYQLFGTSINPVAMYIQYQYLKFDISAKSDFSDLKIHKKSFVGPQKVICLLLTIVN